MSTTDASHHHYFGVECLLDHLETQLNERMMPNCPLCRGSLIQIQPRRLQERVERLRREGNDRLASAMEEILKAQSVEGQGVDWSEVQLKRVRWDAVTETLSFGKGMAKGVWYSFRTPNPLQVSTREEALGILVGFGLKTVVKETAKEKANIIKDFAKDKKDKTVDYIDKIKNDEKNKQTIENIKKNVNSGKDVVKSKLGNFMSGIKNKIKEFDDEKDRYYEEKESKNKSTKSIDKNDLNK